MEKRERATAEPMTTAQAAVKLAGSGYTFTRDAVLALVLAHIRQRQRERGA